jgi:hypothetical protein
MSFRLAVTTIVRYAPLDTPAGWLRVVELDGRSQLAMAPLPDALHRGADPNPRGGLRGGRGLAALPDRLAVAIHDRILVFDTDWRLDRVLSHRWMGGPHDIAADAGGLWVTCADNDLVVRLGSKGDGTGARTASCAAHSVTAGCRTSIAASTTATSIRVACVWTSAT